MCVARKEKGERRRGREGDVLAFFAFQSCKIPPFKEELLCRIVVIVAAAVTRNYVRKVTPKPENVA